MKPRTLSVVLTIALLFTTASIAYVQAPPSSEEGFSLSNAIGTTDEPSSDETLPFPAAPLAPSTSLVRATTAKSIREQTFEPVLETDLFYSTDYSFYAWLHARADYPGQTLRIAWRWFYPNGTYVDTISPWWTFGGVDVLAASWFPIYGANLPLGQWQVQYWIQPSGGNWEYLASNSFQLQSGTLCDQYVPNGGFEAGSQGWQKSANVTVDTSRPHWGTRSAVLGGGHSQGYYLYQQLTLPQVYSQSPTLALYFSMYSEDVANVAYDFLRIQIRDAQGTLLRTLDEIDNTRYYQRFPPDAWQPLTWDLSDFAGQTIRVYISAETDSSLVTRWYIDDVSLTTCPLADPETREERLAKRFAPIVFIHPEDIYWPNRVTVLLNDSQLKSADDQVLVDNPTEQTFDDGQYRSADYYLDIEGKSLNFINPNTQQYRDYYAALSRDDYPAILYAHVVNKQGQQTQDGCTNCTVIQYWFFYYFNPWRNLHEGDWEMVQIIVDKERNDKPVRVAYSQHDKFPGFPGGTRLNWEDVPFRTGDHPWVFVANGSHASYFSPAIYRPFILTDVTSAEGTVILPPNVDDPNIDEYAPADRTRWGNPYAFLLQDNLPSWVEFAGTWGHDGWPTAQLFGKAPVGPRFSNNRIKWDQPLEWVRQLPSDSTWWFDSNASFRAYVASNVQLHLYDAQNRHVGLNAGGGVDLQIPGSSYQADPTEPSAFIQVLPASLANGYRLELRSQGSGTFHLGVQVPDPVGGVAHAAWYAEVSFGPLTIGRLIFNPQVGLQSTAANLTLELDYEGDGSFETQIVPTSSSQDPFDTTPPAGITNLSITLNPNQPNSVRLRWTAPVDIGMGVIRYEVRYAPFPITLANWGTATRARDVLVPQGPGQLETLDVTGVNFAQARYFAVRSVDAGHNVSPLSNVVRLVGIYLPFIRK